jgi:hypothetical protein
LIGRPARRRFRQCPLRFGMYFNAQHPHHKRHTHGRLINPTRICARFACAYKPLRY